MDDLISRQAAKELAHNQVREKYCGMALKEHRDFYIKLADSIIDLLPSEPHWIPVTERVPQESGFYVVSGSGKRWICKFTTMFGIGGWMNSASNPAVKAWLPIALPEPYEEVTE